MKQLIQPSVSPALNCGYIQTANQRVEEMCATRPHPLEPPTVSELEEVLGERIEKCELFKKNWRNRVYQVELASGKAAIAKQVIVGTNATLQYQYDQLRALGRLPIPGLRVPKALGLLRAKQMFVMEFAHGKAIRTLAWDGARREVLLPACELAGKILAQIHLAWTQKIAPMPVELLACDVAAAPWRLTLREQKTLQSAFKTLAKAAVSMGQVYYDYNPANLLFGNNELFLIDPPDVLRQGVHLWDFSRFQGDMRRLVWRLSLRRPFARWRAVVRQGITTFERGYLQGIKRQHPEPALFAPAARLFELQHTALSMTMQRGKLRLARQNIPLGRDHRLGNAQANLTTMALLEMEKRWLFRQLALELP